ncbi:MAG: cupin, partial [Pseudomonadota bacterium]
FCYKGWVDLVYEDQGDPFRLEEGCCVIQPPEIRHRVLFASDNIEVIEIGVPAEHITTIDHDMTLPNGPANPDRRFQGQRFVHHKVDEANWRPFRLSGFEARDTGISDGTQGVAGVQVARRSDGATSWAVHDSDILFSFVMAGSMRLIAAGRDPVTLAPGDAFVTPPSLAVRYDTPSNDLELLEVSLPGVFQTQMVDPA